MVGLIAKFYHTPPSPQPCVSIAADSNFDAFLLTLIIMVLFFLNSKPTQCSDTIATIYMLSIGIASFKAEKHHS